MTQLESPGCSIRRKKGRFENDRNRQRREKRGSQRRVIARGDMRRPLMWRALPAFQIDRAAARRGLQQRIRLKPKRADESSMLVRSAEFGAKPVVDQRFLVPQRIVAELRRDVHEEGVIAQVPRPFLHDNARGIDQSK